MPQELPAEIIVAIERIVHPNKEQTITQMSVQDALNQLFPDGSYAQLFLRNIISTLRKKAALTRYTQYKRSWRNNGLLSRRKWTYSVNHLQKSKTRNECSVSRN
jgi:hypothetical protein